jgi:hypothetical protein
MKQPRSQEFKKKVNLLATRRKRLMLMFIFVDTIDNDILDDAVWYSVDDEDDVLDLTSVKKKGITAYKKKKKVLIGSY